MPADDLSLTKLIDKLLAFNTDTLGVFTSLLQKMEGDLLTTTPAQLQGEGEEILRVILDATDKSMTTVLALQQNLQTKIIESFFPAQD
jgi:hypothetical protein